MEVLRRGERHMDPVGVIRERLVGAQLGMCCGEEVNWRCPLEE